MTIKNPQPENVTPTTPLRLQVAARLAFPAGSMSASALRRLALSGQVDPARIAGKIFVTLNAIAEMRTRCRVPAKAPISPSNVAEDEPPNGLSEMAKKSLAQDVMNATAMELI